MVALVAGQGEVDKDVEVISGKDHPENHPLDAKIVGRYPNDIYAPPVSFKWNCGKPNSNFQIFPIQLLALKIIFWH